MTRFHKIGLLCAMVTGAGPALAGGLDLSGQGISPLFEEGRYAQLSFGLSDPNVSGNVAGADTGIMGRDLDSPGAAYKADIDDKLSYALIFDTPFARAPQYRQGALAGIEGSVDSKALTALVRYKLSDRISVYGGLRAQRMTADSTLATPGGPYLMETDPSTGFGYVVGAAYEIPEYKLLASLTWSSEVEHEFDATENGTASEFDATTPQSINFDLRSGVNENTLVYFSARWAEWTSTSVTPPGFAAATGGASILSYDSDVWSYSGGVIRRLTPEWAGIVGFGYEPETGDPISIFSPTDGSKRVVLGAIYTRDNMRVRFGGSYTIYEDTTGTFVTPGGALPAEFDDNHTMSFGVQVGWQL